MHYKSEEALKRLDFVIHILRANPRNNGLIQQLQHVRQLIVELGVESVEWESAYRQASQYLPYLPDDFEDVSDNTTTTPD